MKQPQNTIKSALQQTVNPNPSNAAPKPTNEASAQPEKRSSARDGKKLISGHFDKQVHYRLKRIALETYTTIQDLLGEALNLLFQQYENH